MIDETNTIEAPESVFIIAARKCPPSHFVIRGVLELMNHFRPDVQPGDDWRQVDGTFIGGSEARQAILEMRRILGPFHPLLTEASHALREELRR